MIDPNGRAYFSFLRDGTPLSKPRKIFSETFIIIAAVRYALVTGDKQAADIARRLYRMVVDMADTPEAGSQKAIPGVRPMIDRAGVETVAALAANNRGEILDALSRIGFGNGRIIITTLRILPELGSKQPQSAVPKKLFLNLLEQEEDKTGK